MMGAVEPAVIKMYRRLYHEPRHVLSATIDFLGCFVLHQTQKNCSEELEGIGTFKSIDVQFFQKMVEH